MHMQATGFVISQQAFVISEQATVDSHEKR